MFRIRTVAALLSALAFVGAPTLVLAEPPKSPRPAAQAGAMPATAAGRVAGSYLAMFNGGSVDEAAAWEKANRTPARLGEADAKERGERIARMRKDFGSLTVVSVTDCGEECVFVEAMDAQEKPIGLNFVLDAKNPGKLDYIEVSSGGPVARPEAIDKSGVRAAVEGVAKVLEDKYVFPEMGAKMAAGLRESLARGELDGMKTDGALARRLTGDLQKVSRDKHLSVVVAPPAMRTQAPPRGGDDEDHKPSAEDLRMMARENFGFRKVERLPGNIGYVKFDFFAGVDEAIPTFDAAMGFVANCDAIIFDMRENGGGSPEAIRQISSYLFDQKTHLNDMIDREGKVVEEYWTLEKVAGKRVPAGVPVYVLTAARTFSGAEEFTYNLKNLKRATVIGETTGGGAHPVRGEIVAEHYLVRVPFMRANNPISKTNWEGTGVEPDIKVPASEALDRAISEARKAIEKRPDGK